MTTRIRDFLRSRREDGPCLVVDLDLVRDNYSAFAKALPDTRVYYAVKALIDPDLPPNAGYFRAIEVIATPGSIFNALSPAAVGDRDRKSTRLNSSHT